MATIVGGIATSHTPTIAFAKDANKMDDPVWKPIFEGFEPVQEWLREKKRDEHVFHRGNPFRGSEGVHIVRPVAA